MYVSAQPQSQNVQTFSFTWMLPHCFLKQLEQFCFHQLCTETPVAHHPIPRWVRPLVCASLRSLW